MQTSKVKEIKQVRSWNGGKTPMWFFAVEMENGDKGDVTRFKEDGLRVGDELTYKVEPNGNYTRLTEEKKNTGRSFGGAVKPSNASVALQVAGQIAAANISVSDKPVEMASLTPRITAMADALYSWLEGKQ